MYCWFSHDVTKIQTTKLSILLRLYFHGVLELLKTNAPINVKSAEGEGGRAWGGDLIVFVGPGIGHLSDLVFPGEGILESFFAQRGDI